MASSDKEKEKTGGLVYAISLNPLDLAHLVHNGCDKGLERVQISVRRQGLEDVGEVEAWVAEGQLHQHLLESPAQILRDSSASCFGIFSRSHWRAVAMPLKNKLSLALG